MSATDEPGLSAGAFREFAYGDDANPDGWPSDPAEEFHALARDDAALGGALRELVASAALRQEMGSANRAKAEREFDQQRMFDAWAELLIGRPPR